MRISDWSSDVCSSDLNAVAAALNLQGFTTRDNIKAAEQIATVDVQRGIQPSALPARSPVTIGVGGGTYGGGLGIGLGTSFGLGKGKSRSEEHTSELQSLMRNSYAVFCLKKNKNSSHFTISNTALTFYND